MATSAVRGTIAYNEVDKLQRRVMKDGSAAGDGSAAAAPAPPGASATPAADAAPPTAPDGPADEEAAALLQKKVCPVSIYLSIYHRPFSSITILTLSLWCRWRR